MSIPLKNRMEAAALQMTTAQQAGEAIVEELSKLDRTELLEMLAALKEQVADLEAERRVLGMALREMGQEAPQ